MGNELSQHIDQAQKSGILQLRNFKLTKVTDSSCNSTHTKHSVRENVFMIYIKYLKIPPEIATVAQFLRNLDLSNNKIPQLPANFFTNMKLLKTLNLSSNRLGNLFKFAPFFNI